MSTGASDAKTGHPGGGESVDGRQHAQLADWDRSDEYHNSFLVKKDNDLDYALEASQKARLPEIGMHARLLFTKNTDGTNKSCDRGSRQVSPLAGEEHSCKTSLGGRDAWRVCKHTRIEGASYEDYRQILFDLDCKGFTS